MIRNLPISQDWSMYREWTTEHEVKKIFNKFYNSVKKRKGEGCCVTSLDPSEEECIFLSQCEQDIRKWNTQGNDKPAARMPLLEPGENEQQRRQFLCNVLGAQIQSVGGRYTELPYALTQLSYMQCERWQNPAYAMLYVASQAAAHEVIATCKVKTEGETTGVLTEKVRANLASFFEAARTAKAPLPKGIFLDVGTASMQGRKDWMSADLALIVGTNIMNRQMYRVVVLQAKWDSEIGEINVRHNKGIQLDEIMSTGMGYYITYPKKYGGRSSMMTVLPAENVFKSVWKSGRKPRFGVSSHSSSHGTAWDFATFFAIALTSDTDLGLGRIFRSAKEAADALFEGRGEACVDHVLAVDLTRNLNVHEVIRHLENKGLVAGPLDSAPSFVEPTEVKGTDNPDPTSGFKW